MEPIAPALPHRFQRWVFALAIFGFLGLPFALQCVDRPTLRDRFRSVPTAGGDFAAIEHVVLDERGDIDVLVLGTSYLWAAIDTPFLEKSLRHELGRPLVARTVGSNFRGEEMYLALLSEVVRRRKVRVLVLSMPGVRDRRDAPHPYAHRIAGPDFLSMHNGLPLRQRGAALGVQLLGGPRHALALLRTERTEVSPLVANKGAFLSHTGFAGEPFREQLDEPPSLAAEELIYGPRSASRFCVLDDPLNEIQLHFTKKTIRLAEDHDVRVVIVHVPTWNDRVAGAPNEQSAWPDCVDERMNYPELFPRASLVGMSARTLFGAMTDEHAKLLFYSGHMNANGARYFTTALLPAFVELVR